MMMRLSCRQCRKLLPGYIGRELTPRQRERVSRHLNTCAECYVALAEQRQLVHELTYSLPRIGASEPRLDKIRAGIMADMRQPEPSKSGRARLMRTQARYSFAALVLMIALLLPWSIQSRAFALPTPPQPETTTPQGTPVVLASATEEAPTLTATLVSNYAPATPTPAFEAVTSTTEVLSATEAP
jgi:anti-sigma factor RsiW